LRVVRIVGSLPVNLGDHIYIDSLEQKPKNPPSPLFLYQFPHSSEGEGKRHQLFV
jgi:hypothetical protein